MDYKHLVEDIKHNVQRFKDKPAMYYKNNALNKWEGISWSDFGERIQQLSKALLKFGIQPQQNVGIFSENKPEWIISDISIMSIRAVTIPIYATNSKKEVEYIVNDAEISILFVGSQDAYDKSLEISRSNEFLKLIIAIDKDIVLKNK